jgi:phosphoribosylformylglycinamidine synthase
MLVIVKPQHEDDVRALFEHWELHCATIGVVTDDGIVRIRDGATEVAAVHAKLLTDAPTYVREGQKPHWLDAVQQFDFSALPDIGAEAYNGTERANIANDTLLNMLSSPEIASRRIVWRQYDHQVGTDTVVGPGSDAAVVRIKGTNKALAIATDGNAAYTHLDPYTGGAIAVCEAARNVACTGARPLAMTNCLNFGNPEKPEVYWQLSECIRGMADAAKALGLPVISGNVSLYNETNGEPIWPTPVVGVVGLIDDVARVVPMGFRDSGDTILLLWSTPLVLSYHDGKRELSADLAGNAYVAATSGVVAGNPKIHLDGERRLIRALMDMARRGLVKSAHDVSAGGLAITLAECAMMASTGARAGGISPRADAALFGEGKRAILVTCAARDEDEIVRIAQTYDCIAHDYGMVGGHRLRFGPIDLPLDALEDAHESGLPGSIASKVQSWSGFASRESTRFSDPAAWEHKQALREEAIALGLSLSDSWPPPREFFQRNLVLNAGGARVTSWDELDRAENHESPDD